MIEFLVKKKAIGHRRGMGFVEYSKYQCDKCLKKFPDNYQLARH
jgi:hypothetical protein